jgi:hypothetical protein
MNKNMHKKTNPPTRHPLRLKPWRVVTGEYRSVPIYKLVANSHVVCPVRSLPERQYYCCTNAGRILALAKLLADSPPIPRPTLDLIDSIGKSLQGPVVDSNTIRQPAEHHFKRIAP